MIGLGEVENDRVRFRERGRGTVKRRTKAKYMGGQRERYIHEDR